MREAAGVRQEIVAASVPEEIVAASVPEEIVGEGRSGESDGPARAQRAGLSVAASPANDVDGQASPPGPPDAPPAVALEHAATWRSTPASWRVAALSTLGAGIAIGIVASDPRVPRWPARLVALALVGGTVPLARASRRPPIPPGRPLPADGTPPTFSIVVGARDEAAVVSRLVRDVAAQDHRHPDGRPRFELIVVDDRSTDGTGERALREAAECGIADVTRVIRREGDGLPDGKGAALTAAQPDVCRGDVVAVLDADARIGPDFLRRAAAYFAAGAPAVTARRRILDSERDALTAAQADEQTLDGELQRARWALGGCSEFRGNGIMVRRDLLARVGGWRASALTEDLDLSSRVAAAEGVGVAWAIDAEVWEEAVLSWQGLWQQRLRWAEGALRRACEHGPSVIRSPRLSVGAKVDFATYAGQLAAPPVVVGLAVGAVVRRRPGPLPELAAGYLALGAILAWDSLRWERDGAGRGLTPGRRLVRAVRAGLFNGLWLAVVPRAMWNLATRRGAVRYVKMDHVGSGDGPEGDRAVPTFAERDA